MSVYDKFDASLTGLETSLSNIERDLFESRAFTSEGKDERFQASTGRHRAHAIELKATIGAMQEQVDTRLAAARAHVLPVATDDTAALAAEMHAARILARPGMNQPEEAAKWLKASTPSPARTIALEELQARGTLKAEWVEGALNADPVMAAATRDATNFSTLINNVWGRRLDHIIDRLKERAPELEQATGHEFTRDSTLMGADLPELTPDTPVQAWNRTADDTLLATRYNNL